MKTRLLRKLRREAKRYVKIVNELEYGRYAIILKDKKQKSNFPISYFHWPSLAMVKKSDVNMYFLCNVYCGVICPPNMNLFEKMAFAQSRMVRKGGYNNIVASVVIAASLTKGEFTDSFLFQE